jgi:hypothetical protein
MNQSQKEFEVWAAGYHGIYIIGSVNGHYSNPAVAHDWLVWQASRTSLAVELKRHLTTAMDSSGVRYK